MQSSVMNAFSREGEILKNHEKNKKVENICTYIYKNGKLNFGIKRFAFSAHD